MAENWIKVRKSLKSDMRVIRSARDLGVSVNEYFGALVAFFCWADEHSADGGLPGLLIDDIDDPMIGGLPGLGSSLESIGWITTNDEGLTINGFDQHMSQSAKRRATDLKRKHSAKVPQTFRNETEESRKKSGTDKSKSKSKSKSKNNTKNAAAFDWADAPQSLNTPKVQSAMEEWHAYRRECGWSAWKPITIKTKLTEYENRPDDLIAAIRHSIGNGWRGIFAPNNNGNGKNGTLTHETRAGNKGKIGIDKERSLNGLMLADFRKKP